MAEVSLRLYHISVLAFFLSLWSAGVRYVTCSECVHLCLADHEPTNYRLGADLPACTTHIYYLKPHSIHEYTHTT